MTKQELKVGWGGVCGGRSLWRKLDLVAPRLVMMFLH